jgi:hypothetical protein
VPNKGSNAFCVNTNSAFSEIFHYKITTQSKHGNASGKWKHLRKYRVIILSDSYQSPLNVSLFIIFMWLGQLTAPPHPPPTCPHTYTHQKWQEVINNCCQIKYRPCSGYMVSLLKI